jgi:hypothetical protein
MNRKKNLRLALLAVAALMVMVVAKPAFSYLREFLEQRRCAQNMRIIHQALAAYLHDHDGVWPQGPAPDESGWAEFWIAALKPYGVEESDWKCPSVPASEDSNGPDPVYHYVPTMFDGESGTAYRWQEQPWLIERVDSHRGGPLILFPDGSVRSYEGLAGE